MEINCSEKCAKVLLLLYTTLIWLTSITLLCIGIYYLAEDERTSLYRLFTTPKYNYALLQFLAWTFIFIASVSFFISICGCCATLKNNRCLLVLYAICLMGTFALELAASLLALTFQDKVLDELKANLTNKLQNEYGLHTSFTAAVDLAQTKFECCGIESPNDYEHSLWYLKRLNGPDSRVSRTCCQLKNRNDIRSHMNPRPVNETQCQTKDSERNKYFRHQKGCLTMLEWFIKSESMMFVTLCCCLASMSLVGILISICFCRTVRATTPNENISGKMRR